MIAHFLRSLHSSNLIEFKISQNVSLVARNDLGNGLASVENPVPYLIQWNLINPVMSGPQNLNVLTG